MTKYYGVKCKTCEMNIALGKPDVGGGNTIAFYTTPLEPVPCTACGSSYLYGSDDLFFFHGEDGILGSS